jgi:hypothetical protein
MEMGLMTEVRIRWCRQETENGGLVEYGKEFIFLHFR